MAQSQSDTVHVFDTWVKGTKGLLHFDVMTTDEATALTLAKQHLASLGEGSLPVTVKECQFCHTEPLVMFSPEQQRQFREQGGLSSPSRLSRLRKSYVSPRDMRDGLIWFIWFVLFIW